MDETIEVDGREIKITHPDKLMFPADKITKEQVVAYYLKAAKYMLPTLKDRPVVLQRWPDGIDEPSFYQKEASDYFPAWIKTTTVELVKGGKQRLVIIDSAAALAYLANQGTLTFHIWLSRLPKLSRPDRLVFDFDPTKNKFSDVIKTARLARKVLQTHGYKSHPMTTGSKGLHVVVELDQKRDFKQVRDVAEALAEEILNLEPKILTTEIRKNKRKGRIYIDIARNGYGQTQVAPYSLRALPGASVALPVDWDSLAKLKTPRQFNLNNALSGQLS